MPRVHSGIINALLEHKNKLWIGTDEGLKIYDGNSVRMIDEKDGLDWAESFHNPPRK